MGFRHHVKGATHVCFLLAPHVGVHLIGVHLIGVMQQLQPQASAKRTRACQQLQMQTRASRGWGQLHLLQVA